MTSRLGNFKQPLCPTGQPSPSMHGLNNIELEIKVMLNKHTQARVKRIKELMESGKLDKCLLIVNDKRCYFRDGKWVEEELDGGIVGQRADAIIIDDPISVERMSKHE